MSSGFRGAASVDLEGSECARRSTYFVGEPRSRVEVGARVKRLKDGKTADKDEVRGEFIKREGCR